MNRDPAPSGPVMGATVKWFNPEKGFGFVELESGGDAFLHAAVLQRAGHEQVSPGAHLQVRSGQGAKGPQVVEVLEVDESTATPAASGPRMGGGGRGGMGGGMGGGRSSRPMDMGPSVEMTGTVKWYNPDKGFGFVAVEDGGKDVFVHATTVERSGLSQIGEGQRVTIGVVERQKGREAVSIRLD